MLFGSVEIPEELLEALQNNKLVVFAGAGVSRGEPAKYPGFGELAEKINGGTLDLPKINEKGIWDEPIDRFLGRLEEKGVNVKKLACQLLNLPDSKPTILHQSLTKLFKVPNKLRLVTTNFDPLFNNYAKELWEQNDLDYYYAPALPLGNDFTGIVYLHGSVLRDEKHIVITDKDFGRAYLTEGWARNFLQAMFSEYTVLFIGYSYTDPVIPYLTRGLPPNSNNSHFAFIGDDDDPTRWEYLNIQPVTYSKKNKREALGICLQSWVEHIEMGALKHEHRIKEIVSSPSPPLESKDLSYIKNVFKDIAKIGHFIKHCNKTLDWLYWANREGVFNELFQLNSPISDISSQMSEWLARYIVDYPEATLRFFQSKGNILHRQLWCLFFDKIWRTDNARMEPNIFLRWIIFLLHDCQVQYQSSFISHVFEKCKYPDDKQAVLLLFEYLIKPRWVTSHEISLIGDNYWLKKTWKDFFKPNLSGFAINLEPIVTSHLQKASWMTNAIYRDNENFCFLSGFRLTIEPYQDASDYRRRDIDILIDAARDILENLLINQPDYAHGIIEGWNISGIRILQRLAIHGIIKSVQLSSDEKIQWLIKNALIINYYSFKDEIYRLLKNSYSLASNATRLSLLEEVESLHRPVNQQDENYVINHEYFLILRQLHELSPECDLVTQKFEKIKQAFADFESEEHPNIAYSPVSAEELLQKNLADIDTVNWLLTYDVQKSLRSQKDYLLTEIQRAVSQDFEWSYQLAQTIQKRRSSSSDIWSDIWQKILLGWQNTKFTEEQWKLVLTFLINDYKLHPLFLDQIADLLDVRQERNEMPISCFFVAKELAKELVNNLQLTPENYHGYHRRISGDCDWIEEMINHPGGKIILFWLRMLFQEQSDLKQFNNIIPDEYKENFRQILEGNYYEVELGRVMLCNQLSFLFSLDSEWTQENIIPLFNWSTNQRQAQQAWYGFLWLDRWYEQILPTLLPLYKQTFRYVSTELSREPVSGGFLSHIVSIVTYAPQSFFAQESQGKLSFIFDFLKQVNSKIRKKFAWTISYFLEEMEEDSLKNLWSEWLKNYWEERNIGRPISLESDELKEMINWLIYLKPVFNEAVDLFCESPISTDTNFLNSHLVDQLEEDKDYSMRYPEALTKLLLHLLKNTSQTQIFYFDYIEKIFRQLIDTEISRNELHKICDELSRLNCPNALELSQLLDNKN